jgi:hypothetical protein
VQVSATHPGYDAEAPQWSRARDVIAGEDAVKAAGEKYLPKLDSQSEEEYAAYKARASFFGATARTLEEYLDLIFRRAPLTSLPSSDVMRGFASDCDRWSTSLAQYARRIVSEVLSVGRAGSLVLWDDASKRPWVSSWRAEEILNWAVEWVAGKPELVELVLREDGIADSQSTIAKRRVLRLDETNGTDGTTGTECVMEVWAAKDQSDEKDASDWELVESQVLLREGKPLSFIPFVFHGPRGSLPERSKLPLADIITANLDHYRLDADYKHGLHFAALPTAWVSGFDKAAPLRIGSSTAWVSEVPGASAGFLEFTGAGLAHLERAMEKVERRMALLGARMLEGSEGDADGASSEGEMFGLASIVANLNASLSRVLQLAQWWVEGGEAASAAATGFAMNTDLGARAMSGEEITAVVAAWRSGAISRDSMLERLKRGEVLPDGRSVAQERALIYRKVES